MKRKAIIIGSNFDTKLSGVQQDILAWHEFLLSPVGGAWNSTEIEVLEHATTSASVLKEIAKAAYADYAFITFSGHGGIYKHHEDALGFDETFIYLTEDEILSERQLNPGNNCSRCTIILDCCRKHVQNLSRLVKLTSVQESNLSERKYSRELFDAQLERSEKGCTRIYATELDSEAADVNSFSRIMIESAKFYLHENEGCNILTLKDAAHLALKEMSSLLPQQKPQYLAGRRLEHYPFAINPIILG